MRVECLEFSVSENTNATPKITGSQKQDWTLDKKNKQLARVHITPRKAFFVHQELRKQPAERRGSRICCR